MFVQVILGKELRSTNITRYLIWFRLVPIKMILQSIFVGKIFITLSALELPFQLKMYLFFMFFSCKGIFMLGKTNRASSGIRPPEKLDSFLKVGIIYNFCAESIEQWSHLMLAKFASCVENKMKCLMLLDVVGTSGARERYSSKWDSYLDFINFLSNNHTMVMFGIENSW